MTLNTYSIKEFMPYVKEVCACGTEFFMAGYLDDEFEEAIDKFRKTHRKCRKNK